MSESVPPSNAESVERGIALFVERMLDDPLVSWAFEDADQVFLRRHASAFVIAALGGPDLYLGRDMRTVHDRFKLTDAHFDAAVVHLIESLGEAGIAESVLAELAIRLEPLRALIVTR